MRCLRQESFHSRNQSNSKRFGAIYPHDWIFKDFLKSPSPTHRRFASTSSSSSQRSHYARHRCSKGICSKCPANRPRPDSGVFPLPTGGGDSSPTSASSSTSRNRSASLKSRLRWPFLSDREPTDTWNNSSEGDRLGPLGALEIELRHACDDLNSTVPPPTDENARSQSSSPRSAKSTSSTYPPSSLSSRSPLRSNSRYAHTADCLTLLQKQGIRGVWSSSVHNAPIEGFIRTGIMQTRRKIKLTVKAPILPMKAKGLARRRTLARPPGAF
jgi:hypothetical protein